MPRRQPWWLQSGVVLTKYVQLSSRTCFFHNGYLIANIIGLLSGAVSHDAMVRQIMVLVEQVLLWCSLRSVKCSQPCVAAFHD